MRKLSLVAGVAAALAVFAPVAASASVIHNPTPKPTPTFFKPPIKHLGPICSPVFGNYDGFQQAGNGRAIVSTGFFGQVSTTRSPSGCGLVYFPNSDTANNGKDALIADAAGNPASPLQDLQASGNRLVVGAAHGSANEDWVSTEIGSGHWSGWFTWTVGGKQLDVNGITGQISLLSHPAPASADTAFQFHS